VCLEHRIDLRPEWLPREENVRADNLSIRDVDDFGVSSTAFAQISTAFGPFSVDRFASPHNAKLALFDAFFWCPGVEGVNAFTQDWGGADVSYCFPPPHLVPRTLQHARACSARIALVVLGWRSAPWWPLLCGSVVSGRGFAPFVRRHLFFPQAREVLVPGLASADQFCGKAFLSATFLFWTSTSLAGELISVLIVFLFILQNSFSLGTGVLNPAACPLPTLT
jgi:hypothetical protein